MTFLGYWIQMYWKWKCGWFIDDFLWIRSKCEIRYYQLFNASFCVVARQIVVSFSGDLPKEVVRNMLWYYNEAVENYLYLVLHFQCYKFNRVIKSNLTSVWNSDRSSWKNVSKEFCGHQIFPTRIIETFCWHLLCLINIDFSCR